jgi:hypothetical protein
MRLSIHFPKIYCLPRQFYSATYSDHIEQFYVVTPKSCEHNFDSKASKEDNTSCMTYC